MQGLAVVPLFCGYDLARGNRAHLHLRRDRRPLRGSRLPGDRVGRARRPHHDQLGFRDGLTRDEGIELAVEALYEAADEDAATGGPTSCAASTARGRRRRDRLCRAEEAEVAERFNALIERRRAERAVGGRGEHQ